MTRYGLTQWLASLLGVAIISFGDSPAFGDTPKAFGIPRDVYQELAGEGKVQIDGALGFLEMQRGVQVSALQDLAGDSWKDYVDGDELPNERGLKLIAEAAALQGVTGGEDIEEEPVSAELETADVPAVTTPDRQNSLFGLFPLPTVDVPLPVGEIAVSAGGFAGGFAMIAAVSSKGLALAAAGRAMSFRDLAMALAAKAQAAALAGKFKDALAFKVQAGAAKDAALANKTVALKHKAAALKAASWAKWLGRATGVIQIGDGSWDVYKGFSDRSTQKKALTLERGYRNAYAPRAREELPSPHAGEDVAQAYLSFQGLEATSSQISGLAQVIGRQFEALDSEIAQGLLASAQAGIDELKRGISQANERITVGFLKLTGGALTLGGTFMAPGVGVIATLVGSGLYTATSLYQHWDSIKAFPAAIQEAFRNSAEYYANQPESIETSRRD